MAVGFKTLRDTDNLISKVVPSERIIVVNTTHMLRHRGLTCTQLGLCTNTNRVSWIIVAIPSFSHPIRTCNYIQAEQPTVVMRISQRFSGRDPSKLLQQIRTDNDITKFMNEFDDARSRRYIIITNDVNLKRKTISSTITTKSSNKHPDRLDIFAYGSFRFNILNHELVPRHTPLSFDELKQLAIKYGVQNQTHINSQLNNFILSIPTISYRDPVVRYLGGIPNTNTHDLSSGSIYCINRGGGEIIYRRVVKDIGK